MLPIFYSTDSKNTLVLKLQFRALVLLSITALDQFKHIDIENTQIQSEDNSFDLFFF